MTGTITPEEAGLWAKLIYNSCGVHLDQSKAYLITARLQELVKETNSAGFADLYLKVRTSSALQLKVVDAITTNETSFFRDTTPFDLIRHKVVPDLLDRRSKGGLRPFQLRIWSAACSTGQEVYTVAILLRELLPASSRYDVRIHGTDISNRVIAIASRGQYSALEVQRGLPPEMMAKYFVRTSEGWKISDEIRAMASFKTMNLLQPFEFQIPFDIVLCRNVAIYFTEQDRARLFGNMGKYLANDGALIIGSTESLAGLSTEFEPRRYLRSIYYQKKMPS